LKKRGGRGVNFFFLDIFKEKKRADLDDMARFLGTYMIVRHCFQ